MNQLKEFGKEFNIYQLKPKLFIILKEITMFLAKVNILKLAMSREVINKDTNLDINKEPPMFHQVTVLLTFKEVVKVE